MERNVKCAGKEKRDGKLVPIDSVAEFDLRGLGWRTLKRAQARAPFTPGRVGTETDFGVFQAILGYFRLKAFPGTQSRSSVTAGNLW